MEIEKTEQIIEAATEKVEQETAHASEPVAEPTTAPATETETEPTTEPTTEPAPVAEPTTELTTEPEPASEPATETTSESKTLVRNMSQESLMNSVGECFKGQNLCNKYLKSKDVETATEPTEAPVTATETVEEPTTEITTATENETEKVEQETEPTNKPETASETEPKPEPIKLHVVVDCKENLRGYAKRHPTDCVLEAPGLITRFERIMYDKYDISDVLKYLLRDPIGVEVMDVVLDMAEKKPTMHLFFKNERMESMKEVRNKQNSEKLEVVFAPGSKMVAFVKFDEEQTANVCFYHFGG